MPEDYNTTNMKEDVTKSILKWLGAQSFNNILMLLVLFILSWLAYNLVSITLPAIHNYSREYHKDILQSAENERQLILDNAEKERDKLSLMYDRWVHLLIAYTQTSEKEHNQ